MKNNYKKKTSFGGQGWLFWLCYSNYYFLSCFIMCFYIVYNYPQDLELLNNL